MDQSHERKLAAIMFTDIVGFTDLMGKNESEAFELINTKLELIKPIINSFNGTLIKEMGDGTISSFNSAVEASNCGLEIQRILKHNSKLTIRIGIHIGDIVEKDGDVFGDGVNIASRLESISEPGSICISERVYEDLKNKPEITTKLIGEKELKGVETPITVYKILTEDFSKQSSKTNSTIQTEKKNNIGIVLFASVIVVFFLFYYYNSIIVSNQSNDVNPKSVAVLPFNNFSPSPDDEFLSDGFTEVIIANLAKVKDLMVISRTSVMRYKDKDMNLKEIAHELGVANILEGSIQRTDNKIRVVGQLIEAQTDNHLWSETYDEDFDDIFSVQTSIAKEIASALKSKITESEKLVIEEKLTDNIEAYELYLKVKELRRQGEIAYNNKIRKEILKKIIEIDPEFAEAYALLSIEYSEKVHFGINTSQKKKEKARMLIETAFSLKPESANVRFAYGYYYYGCYKDYLKVLEHYNFALLKEPGNAIINENIGYVHRRLGNWDQAIKYMEKAASLDPNETGILSNIIGTYEFLKRYDKLNYIDLDRQLYRITPESGYLYSRRAQYTFWFEGNTANARKIIKKAKEIIPDYDFYNYPTSSFDFFDQNYSELLNYYQNKKDSILFSQGAITSKYFNTCFVYYLMDDEQNKIQECQKALNMMINLHEYVGEARYHSSLSIIYALLGKAEEAVRESKMGIALSPPSKDMFTHDYYLHKIAGIYLIIGEDDKSIDIIEKLLIGPSSFHWSDFKYDPLVRKRLINNARLMSIIQKDEERFKREATYDLSIYLP